MNPEEKNIHLLAISYLDQTLSAADLQLLEARFIEDPLFKKEFSKSVETYRNYRQLKASQTVDLHQAWEQTKSKFTSAFEPVSSSKIKKMQIQNYYRIAAAVVMLLSVGFLVKVYVIGSKSLDNLKIPEQEITLVLPNGEVQQLDMKVSKNVTAKNGDIVGRQDGSSAKFAENTNQDKLQYNTLKIPFGKQFNVTLSDGTKVYLNAGTTLKFPQHFISNAPLREVEVDGEAYFEVAKNKKQPFVVHSNQLDVTVLGTQFNLRTYAAEKNSEVVLKEGSVLLGSIQKQPVTLKPGYMGYYNKDMRSIKTKEVFVANYISWINGELIYRNVTFETILKSLERHFNVKIENHSNVLKDDRLNVNFGSEPLAKVLAYLHDDFGIDYTIRNNTIILK